MFVVHSTLLLKQCMDGAPQKRIGELWTIDMHIDFIQKELYTRLGSDKNIHLKRTLNGLYYILSYIQNCLMESFKEN